VSWGYHATPDIATGSRFVDYLQWTGARDPTAALTILIAIQFIKDHDRGLSAASVIYCFAKRLSEYAN
jgi:hypothetical protein